VYASFISVVGAVVPLAGQAQRCLLFCSDRPNEPMSWWRLQQREEAQKKRHRCWRRGFDRQKHESRITRRWVGNRRSTIPRTLRFRLYSF